MARRVIQACADAGEQARLLPRVPMKLKLATPPRGGLHSSDGRRLEAENRASEDLPGASWSAPWCALRRSSDGRMILAMIIWTRDHGLDLWFWVRSSRLGLTWPDGR